MPETIAFIEDGNEANPVRPEAPSIIVTVNKITT